jgi:large subunit ribosomal protein L30
MSATLKITLVKSQIGVPQKLRKVLAGLGLRKRQQTVVKTDNPAIRGMIFKVKHLVDVSESEGGT